MRKNIFIVLFIVCLALFSFAACKSDDDNKTPEEPTPSFEIEISGRVIENGTPVEGVKITLKDSNETLQKELLTAKDGLFSFKEIPKTKTINLVLSKSGYYNKTIVLTPLQLNQGKNVMGDINFNKPTVKIDLTGYTKSMDNLTAEKGVKISVEDFDISGVSGSDGKFTLNDVFKPMDDAVLTIKFEKEHYKTVKKEIALKDIDVNGDIGNVIVNRFINPVQGSVGFDYNILRTADGVKFIGEFDKAISGGQHVQLHIQTGDDISGKVYMILMAESSETIKQFWDIDAEYAVWKRTVSTFNKMENSDAEVITFDNADFSVAENKKFELFVPYAELGAVAEEDLGVIVYTQVLSGDKTKWLWPIWANEPFTDGNNQFEYPMFFKWDRDGLVTKKSYSKTMIAGFVEDGNGNKLSNVKIELSDSVAKLHESTTADDGAFDFQDISRVHGLSLKIMKDGFVTKTRNITLEELAGNAINEVIVLEEVKETIAVQGKVKALTGTVLFGVKVRVPGSESFVLTDNSGAFTLSNVPSDTETFEIEYSKDMYETITVTYNVLEVKSANNILSDVKLYSLISPQGQKIEFSGNNGADKLQFRIETGANFEGGELIWFEFQVGDYETGKTFILILSPNGTCIPLEAVSKTITTSGWVGTMLQFTLTPTLNDADKSITFDIEVPYAQFDNFNSDGSIGIGISTALMDGNVVFTSTGSIAHSDVTMIQYHEFFTFTKDNAFVARKGA